MALAACASDGLDGFLDGSVGLAVAAAASAASPRIAAPSEKRLVLLPRGFCERERGSGEKTR